jgi:hypothetical protein
LPTVEIEFSGVGNVSHYPRVEFSFFWGNLISERVRRFGGLKRKLVEVDFLVGRTFWGFELDAGKFDFVCSVFFVLVCSDENVMYYLL